MYADNLLGVTQNFLTPDIVNKFSRAIGESTEKTQKGLKSVIPTLLMGIVDKGQTTDGAETLVNLVNKDGFVGEKAANLNDVSYLNKGTDAIEGIFGNNLNNVVSNLGDTTGIKSSGIIKMLGMAAPLVMGFLGSKMKRDGLSTPGLMGFLGQQKSALSSLVPEGLIGRITGSAAASKKIEIPTVGHEITRSGSPWVTVAIVALAILAGIWWFLGRKQMTEVVPVSPTVISSTLDTDAELAPPVATIPSVDQLSMFLKAGSGQLPQIFHFETLNFDTSSATLMSGSEAELDQLAASLQEFPTVMARIEGHTDNTGVEIANKELSLSRAEAVKNQLVERGVDARRIETAGIGSSSPTDTNNTEAGRTNNRRIEFIVTRF